MATREQTVLAIKKSLRQAHPDWKEDKIVSMAFAIYNSHKGSKAGMMKESDSSFSFGSDLSWKEDPDTLTFYSTGYAATTDFDRVGDILTLDCLEDASSQINNLTHIDSDEVSYRHDRSDPKPMALASHDAKVVPLGEDRYGLKVTSTHVKTHDKYDEYVYDVKNGVVKGYSIEYRPIEVLEDTRVLDEKGNYAGEGHRIINKIELRGYGYASGKLIANPEARLIDFGYKEIISEKGVLSSSKRDESVVNKEFANEIVSKEKNHDVLEGVKMDEVKETPAAVQTAPVVPSVEAVKEVKIDVDKILKEAKEINKTAVSDMVKELLKDPVLVKEFEVKEKVKNTESESKMADERMEIKEFKSIISNKEMDVEVKFKEVGLIAEKMGLVKLGRFGDKLEYAPSTVRNGGAGFKEFRTNGAKLEYKGLSITSNQNSDTDYLLSGAELRDVFDPVIYDALNQSTTTWSLLRKEDFSNKGNNQVQFILETGANSTAGFYNGNAVTLDKSTLFKYQTKFKKVQVGVSIDGDMIAAARGGPVGDVFGLHVRLATKTLLNTINNALFDSVGAESAAALIGFEYITDSATNATLYNVTRSAANKLLPDSAGDTFITGSSARISVDNLRKAIQQAVVEGADVNNLVFICHPLQERLFKGIYDGVQRLMPTSSRFGFTGRPEFDGIPVFADKDANTDDWFLVDLESHKVAIWVPPTLEMLGKNSDAVEGFIKCYLATYNTAPRRMVQIYSNATS